MIEEFLHDYFAKFVSTLSNPQKRVFWMFLLSAGLIAFLWLKFNRTLTASYALKEIFSKKMWWNRSARADYGVWTLNTGVMLILSPRLLGQVGVGILVFQLLHELYGGRPAPLSFVPDWCIMLAFTICLFVLDDFAKYAVHRLLHRVPVLWAFHKVHHSATSLNPITVFRTHPVEGVIFALRGALVHGVCIAIFVFFFGSKVQLITVFGASVLNYAFHALGANLRHSHISIGFWKPVERIFISPAQHQIHHSVAPQHHDKNFGVALAIWDSMFGTLCYSQRNQNLEFGLENHSQNNPHSLRTLYIRPFIEASNVVYRAINRKVRIPFLQSKGLPH